MDYAVLGWQEAVVVGCAKQEGILEAVPDEDHSADELASRLGLRVHERCTSCSQRSPRSGLSRRRGQVPVKRRGPRASSGSGSSGLCGGLVAHLFELIRKWGRMSEILKTGLPAEGDPPRGPEGMETFIYSMRRLAKPGVRAVADLLLSRLPDNLHILDIGGGGPKTYAEAFAEGGARVTVFDLPEMIELMKDRLSAAGISASGGDFNEGLPEDHSTRHTWAAYRTSTALRRTLLS
jgi:hypothetical protein